MASTAFPVNEKGRINEWQQEILRKQRLRYLAGSGVFVAVLVLFIIAVAVKILHPSFGARGPFWLVGAVAVFWLMLLSRSCVQYVRTRRDVREGHVESVIGAVSHRMSSTPGLIRFLRYSIRCGGRQFSVPQEVFFRLQSGTPYHIYYARHSGLFLGAVPCAPNLSTASGSEARIHENRPDDLYPPLPELAPTASEPLLPREQEVLELIAAGLSNQDIADRLFLSVHTIKMYASQLYRKLGVRRRTEAVRRARQMGLLPPL